MEQKWQHRIFFISSPCITVFCQSLTTAKLYMKIVSIIRIDGKIEERLKAE